MHTSSSIVNLPGLLARFFHRKVGGSLAYILPCYGDEYGEDHQFLNVGPPFLSAALTSGGSRLRDDLLSEEPLVGDEVESVLGELQVWVL